MLFSPENEEISAPPCGLLIGIYLFYENWSTETFRKRDSKKLSTCQKSAHFLYSTKEESEHRG
jgi:hypothetical protein